MFAQGLDGPEHRELYRRLRGSGSSPLRRVDSWTTVDVNRLPGRRRLGLARQCAIQSPDQQRSRSTPPPFVNQFDLTSGTFGYDPANASLLGRQVSLQVVKRWGQ